MKMVGNIDDTEVEMYLDNKKVDDFAPNLEDWNSGYEEQYPNSNNDSLANIQIPKAGVITIISLVVIITIAGVVIFIRYKILSKYIK